MDSSDFLFAPIYLLVLYALAYRDRNSKYPKGHPLHQYYMPGLTLKFLGAICSGIVYWFYYKDGDTIYYFWRTFFIYHTFDYNATNGFRMIFGDPTSPSMYDLKPLLNNVHARDTASYMVTRIASFISLFTFCNYSCIALIFAYISFRGIWALFRTFTDLYPDSIREMAIACLYIPSVFFWGSGIFKDTITLTGVCWMTRSAYMVLLKRQNILPNAVIFLIAFYFTFTIKAYIVLCFIPSMLFWIFFTYGSNIKSSGLRFIVAPFILVIVVAMGYFFIKKAGGNDSNWSANQIQDRAKDMQWWHGRVKELYGAEGGGSFYSVGNGSFTMSNLVISFPQAVVVSLFRPFLWEARNPVMFIASLEGMMMLYFTFKFIFKAGFNKVFKYAQDYPIIFFCFFFSIFFAFAVGFTSFNFGALVRYKIPLMPYYVAGLFMVQYHVTKDKNDRELARKLK